MCVVILFSHGCSDGGNKPCSFTIERCVLPGVIGIKKLFYPGIMTSWLILYCPPFCESDMLFVIATSPGLTASCVTRDGHWSVTHEAIIFTTGVSG